jgi:hypothetical protein
VSLQSAGRRIDAGPAEEVPPIGSPNLLARIAEHLAQAVRTHGPVQAASLAPLYRELPEFTRDCSWLGYSSCKALTAAILATRTDLDMSDGPAWSVSLAKAPTRQASSVAGTDPTNAVTADEGLKPRVIETLRALLLAAPGPVPMARAAQELIRVLGPVMSETGWLGAGSFSALLAQCADLGLDVSVSRAPDYLWDAARHEPPQVDTHGDVPDSRPEPLASRIRRLHALTDAPGLSPEQYRALFQCIAEELQQHPYDLMGSGKAVRDRCVSAGQPISRASVSFVLRGIVFAGHSLSDPTGRHTPEALARAFHRNVSTLIEQAQATLTPEEQALLGEWLLGEPPPRALEENGWAGPQRRCVA